MINLYKYSSIRACALVFADLIAELYGDYLKSHTIIPLPTIEKHVRERGFDHTKKLAKAVAKACGAKCAYLLVRGNDCVQVGSNEETRRKQAETAYKVRKNASIRDRVVLLDDVWTTGSSMLAACKELQKAGFKDVSIIELAKSG